MDVNQERNTELMTEKQKRLSLRKMTTTADHGAKTAKKQGLSLPSR